jgi:L-seryl-tRNA(Ser) seleniumtransferase
LSPCGLPHPLLVEVARESIAAGDPAGAPARAEALRRSLLQRVVNATGVLLHTNLGRAALGVAPAPGAMNLELDLDSGRRARRAPGLSSLLRTLTGAPGCVVVNNGAAAVLLALTALADRRRVVVSRGELVEIGGGFRIPEVMAASGMELVEVGTTNRTRLADYAAGVGVQPPLPVVLKVHPSNYRITGFTSSVPVRELAGLGAPVVADLGSGLLDADAPWLSGPRPQWLAAEPGVRQTLEEGAVLVTFSGDKLLGGPQAGIVAGDAELVSRCARLPLARALRPGGLVLAALERTLLAYLSGEAERLPLWRMATTDPAELRRRAVQVAEKAGGGVEVVECTSVLGGGSAPGTGIPSVGVRRRGDHAAALRRHHPPVIAVVNDGGTVCDLRTVDPADDVIVADALAGC